MYKNHVTTQFHTLGCDCNDMGAVRQLYTSFLVMLAAATQKELAAHVQFLRAENRVLRSRLPARITCTPGDRTKLLRYGRKCGVAINDLISIVSWRTFYRWNAEASQPNPNSRRPGRPKTSVDVRKLVLRIAREMGVGYTRVLGELRKLGIKRISRQTVKNIMLDAGIDPAPERSERTWDQFLKSHARTLWARRTGISRGLHIRIGVPRSYCVDTGLQYFTRVRVLPPFAGAPSVRLV